MTRVWNFGHIIALDSVFLDITDGPGFRDDCEHGKALGFDGKTLIHPSQVETANEVFGLSAEQVVHAQRVIDAWQAALAEGKGVAVLDGKPRSATIVAQGALVCLRLSMASLDQVGQAHPEVRHALMAAIGLELTKRIRIANRAMTALKS